MAFYECFCGRRKWVAPYSSNVVKKDGFWKCAIHSTNPRILEETARIVLSKRELVARQIALNHKLK